MGANVVREVVSAVVVSIGEMSIVVVFERIGWFGWKRAHMRQLHLFGRNFAN